MLHGVRTPVPARYVTHRSILVAEDCATRHAVPGQWPNRPLAWCLLGIQGMNTSVPIRGRTHTRIRVVAPARLHLGFLDLNGGLGRRFGSLGLTLESPVTRLHVTPSADIEAIGPGAERAAAFARVMAEQIGLAHGLRVTVEEAIPEHVGLGSGTQLGLAVGMAVCRLAGISMDVREVGYRLDRGARSGIGIGAFEDGGFLVDGGRGEGDAPPPLVARAVFPENWRVVLIYDRAFQGLHGKPEKQAFQDLPTFPEAAAAHLCRLVLMRVLPGLAEQDLDTFGTAITEIQQVVGDHFAPAQGGRFASPHVSHVLQWLLAEGYRTAGQSSWGPTGFTVVQDPAEATALVRRLQALCGEGSPLDFVICRARNCGGQVETLIPGQRQAAPLAQAPARS